MLRNITKNFTNLHIFIKKTLNSYTNNLTEDLELYLLNGSKKIRSQLIFLFANILYKTTSDDIIKLAAAVEIIHNATLIHDDIIDNSDLRRGRITFHKKYDNNLAIISGDFLLSLAIKTLLNINKPNIIDNFADTLINLCQGEINQYFNTYNTSTIENYVLKSKEKTASLFIASLQSLADFDKINTCRSVLTEFAEHFGIAFQIKDDLNNILDENKEKPLLKDIENGIYTAPIIFAFGENKDLRSFSTKQIIEQSQKPENIEKTKALLQTHINLALNTLNDFDDNIYKKAIIDLCSNLRL